MHMKTTRNTPMLVGILFAASLSLFSACDKDPEFEGPSLVDLYGEFSVLSPLEVSNSNVNFAEGESTTFTALFSKNVNWTLRIQGQESGAIREITGFSNELDASNARWTGSTTILPMFREEACNVTLTFANEPDTLTNNLTIEAAKINEGLLLSDFEDGFPADWVPFVQSGANMSFFVDEGPAAGQGNAYYDMGGEVNWDYLIGMFDIPGSAYGEDPSFPLSSNPGNVYFNTLLYNPAGITNAITLIQFREDDNGNGVYENNEDMWSIEVTGLSNGWHHLSSRYSDIPTLVNGAPAAPLGNGVYEPQKLLTVSVLFLANPATGYSQNYIDYLIFTENGPLQP